MTNELFHADYYRMTGERYTPSLHAFVNIILRHNIRFMKLFRKHQKRPALITRLHLFRLSRKYGLEISPRATIGAGLYLGHPYNITVAEGVQLGANVSLHKGCTIGRENRGKRAGVPVIGNRVYVGIGAVVVGHITIGDDVMIAPNSFVNFDVPAHSVVIGNPAVIHPRDNATEKYIGFCD